MGERLGLRLREIASWRVGLGTVSEELRYYRAAVVERGNASDSQPQIKAEVSLVEWQVPCVRLQFVELADQCLT